MTPHFCQFLILFTLFFPRLYGVIDITQEEEKFSAMNSMRAEMRLKPYSKFFSSESIFLRPIFPSDADAFKKTMSDGVYMKHFGKGKVFSSQEVDQLVLKWAMDSQEVTSSFCMWSIISYQGFVGRIFLYPSHIVLKGYDHLVAVAAIINKGFEGCGFATKALEKIIYDENNPQEHYIATVHPENVPSIRMLKKLGFKEIADMQNIPLYNSVRNALICSPHTAPKNRVMPLNPLILFSFLLAFSSIESIPPKLNGL